MHKRAEVCTDRNQSRGVFENNNMHIMSVGSISMNCNIILE